MCYILLIACKMHICVLSLCYKYQLHWSHGLLLWPPLQQDSYDALEEEDKEMLQVNSENGENELVFRILLQCIQISQNVSFALPLLIFVYTTLAWYTCGCVYCTILCLSWYMIWSLAHSMYVLMYVHNMYIVSKTSVDFQELSGRTDPEIGTRIWYKTLLVVGWVEC